RVLNLQPLLKLPGFPPLLIRGLSLFVGKVNGCLIRVCFLN
ncbi:hypothetical protein A2U01_0064976, partial [Trifolium medium]|nr:hypothetical protein [Trifolium medium]